MPLFDPSRNRTYAEESAISYRSAVLIPHCPIILRKIPLCHMNICARLFFPRHLTTRDLRSLQCQSQTNSNTFHSSNQISCPMQTRQTRNLPVSGSPRKRSCTTLPRSPRPTWPIYLVSMGQLPRGWKATNCARASSRWPKPSSALCSARSTR